MKPEYAERLLQLQELRNLSLRSQLILARRIARHSWNEYLLTQANFEAGLKSADKSEMASIKHARAQAAQQHRKTLSDIGTWLCQNEGFLMEKYGFESICDVLEVNPVHRAGVMNNTASEGQDISTFVFSYAFEDSASALAGRHPIEWKEGPLYQAIWEVAKQAQHY